MTTNENVLDIKDYKFMLDDIEQKLKDYIVKNFDIFGTKPSITRMNATKYLCAVRL